MGKNNIREMLNESVSFRQSVEYIALNLIGGNVFIPKISILKFDEGF